MPQKVLIFSLGQPKPGTPRDKRRYRVKWRIDGRDKTRPFKTKAEAERLRAMLVQAQVAGQPFDQATGLPVEWIVSPDTWWSWSREWLALKWPHWSGNSRRSAVESLVALTPHVVQLTASKQPEGLAEYLRQVGFSPGAELDPDGPQRRWLARWSAPLAELDPVTLEKALTAATTNATDR